MTYILRPYSAGGKVVRGHDGAAQHRRPDLDGVPVIRGADPYDSDSQYENESRL